MIYSSKKDPIIRIQRVKERHIALISTADSYSLDTWAQERRKNRAMAKKVLYRI
jgi:hypothetical protein